MDEDEEDDGIFLPMRLFYASSPKERWKARGQQPPPRRLRGLSRADIVATAIAIADAEGTEAISMRRIASDLRVGVMSLYWYVESKEDLHRLMLESVQGEIKAPGPTGDWRADLGGYSRNSRSVLLRHPWAIDFLGSGPPSGPNDARNAERLLAAIDRPGLDIITAMWVLMTVSTYVLGAVLREIQEIRWERGAAAAVTDEAAEEEASELQAEFRRRIRESGRYPQITRILDANIDPDSAQTRDDRFEFGLGCLLDGIAARINRHPR